MATIDTRVVEMQFDNKQFESGVSETLSSLDRLKKALSFGSETKNIESLDSSLNGIDFTKIQEALDVVKYRFSAIGIAGTVAIANITNSVMGLYRQIKNFLVLDPIRGGFAEYETQMNAIQTILSNTRSEGTNIQQVNDALAELNAYADRTIYNFTEMTRNIGTFTAAGVDLNTSVNAIQGIANLAAVSGSTSNQASVAMYQLSQALATGTVKLMDWNSVVNAGMGGQVFQDALRKTSEELGTGAEAAIKAEGSFRESLSVGWLTSQVLTETLKKFTTSGAMEWVANYCDISKDAVQAAYDQAYAASTAEDSFGKQQEAIDSVSESLAEQTGKSKDAIKETLELAYDAQNAATKVKTFSQLIDTLKEALGSGWTKSWQLVIGDFEEARELWTKVSDVLSDLINTSSDARNSMLQDWVDLGGRTALIDGLWQGFYNLKTILGTISTAFRNVFPKITADRLFNITSGFKELMDSLTPTEEYLNKLSRGFSGIFSVLGVGKSILLSVFDGIKQFFSSDESTAGLDHFITKFAEFGDALSNFSKSFSDGTAGESIKLFISSMLEGIVNGLSALYSAFSNFSFVSTIKDVFSKILDAVKSGISGLVSFIKEYITFDDILNAIKTGVIANAVIGVAEIIQSLKAEAKKLLNSSGLIELLTGKKPEELGKSVQEEAKSIVQVITGIDFEGISKNISKVLSSLSDALKALTESVQANTLIKIAIAVGILSLSLQSLSKLDIGQIAQGVVGIFALTKILMASVSRLANLFKGETSQKMLSSATSMLILAGAVKVIADACVTLGALPIEQLGAGLGGLAVLMLELGIFMGNIKAADITPKDSIAMLVMAEAIKILGEAVGSFAGLGWEELARGLIGLGASMIEIGVALRILNGVKIKASTIAAIFVMAQSCKILGEAFKTFSEMTWDQIGLAAGGMGAALTELVIAIGILQRFGGAKALVGALSLAIVVNSLSSLSESFKRFSEMSWDEIGRASGAMGAALAELVAAIGILGGIVGFKSLFASNAITDVIGELPVLAESLQKFASLSWDEIGRGLAAMGGALGEIAVITGALGSFAGLESVIGSFSIVYVSQSLGDIADALIKFASLSWDEIGRGLAAMGGALGEIAGITGALGSFAGLASVIGSYSIVETSKSLGDIADALAKFASLSWDEIGRGLAAMGGALGETALGGALMTFGYFGAGVLKEIAEPLGTLADSMRKWQDVTVPDGIGLSMGAIAAGVAAFTLSGIGGDVLATIAEPLGVLADSIRKWDGVSVPEGIGLQMGQIADGVNKFWMSGMGGDVLATIAEPLGTLADSVKKWSDVTVPENLQTNLEGLAKAVSSFMFSGLAGLSMGAIAEPLGNLADSVKKWSDVTVPENLQTNLEGLAKGIQAFTLAGLAGFSIDMLVGPLGNLAGAISKWKDVVIPDGIKYRLISLSDGVKSFNDLGGASVGLQSTANALDQMAGSLPALQDVGYETIGTGITTLSTALTGLPDATTVATSALSSFAGSLSDVGATISSNLVTGASDGLNSLGDTINNGLSGISEKLSGSLSNFISSGETIMTNMATGVSNNANKLTSAVNTAIGAIKGSININALYSSGIDLMRGLANGITAGRNRAVNAAAAAMARVIAATNRTADINSPSKVFNKIGMYCMQGLGLGLKNNSKYAENAAEATMNATTGMFSNASKMAVLAAQSIQDAIDSDYNPVIRPVLDDRQFKTDLASAINATSMSARSQIRVNASYISKGLAQENQNGFNEQILRSIGKLRKEVAEISKPTYNVGGITYDDGSNVATAVRELTRAVRVERRK